MVNGASFAPDHSFSPGTIITIKGANLAPTAAPAPDPIPPPRQLAGGVFLLMETMAAGVRVYVACIPIRLMLGETVCSLGGLVDPILGAILLFVGLSLLYTYIGGVKAVIWTDAVQFGLFLAGGLFALFYIPTLIDEGLAVGGRWLGVREYLRDHGTFGDQPAALKNQTKVLGKDEKEPPPGKQDDMLVPEALRNQWGDRPPEKFIGHVSV